MRRLGDYGLLERSAEDNHIQKAAYYRTEDEHENAYYYFR